MYFNPFTLNMLHEKLKLKLKKKCVVYFEKD